MPERRGSVLERLQYQIARGLVALPPRAQLFLSGGEEVAIDGQVLHPGMQLVLSLRARNGQYRLGGGSHLACRHRLSQDARIHRGPTVPVGAVTELVLRTTAGRLPARHYVPDAARVPAPLLVFFHGGGYVVCDLDTHDALCRLLCRHARVQVLSVGYRLAPEAPFPAAVEDALAAYAWARSHAAELGADPARIGVGGDSTGGTLATVVAQSARREGTTPPALQFLLYPSTDAVTLRPSQELFAEGFLLTRADVEYFSELYRAPPDDPRVSPALAPDLAGLPPTLLITAGFDPLRDEGEAYARALREAGNRVVARRLARMTHGFGNMTGLTRVAHDAIVDAAHSLHDLFVTIGGPR